MLWNGIDVDPENEPAAPSVSRAGQEKASRDMSRNSAEAYIDPTRVSRAGTTGEETPEVEDNRLVQWARTILAGGKPGVFVTPDKENHARSILAYEARIASLRAELERGQALYVEACGERDALAMHPPESEDTRRLDALAAWLRAFSGSRSLAFDRSGTGFTLFKEPDDDVRRLGMKDDLRAAIDSIPALSNPGASHVE